MKIVKYLVVEFEFLVMSLDKKHVLDNISCKL